MDYLITLTKPWRYRHRKRGQLVLEPGRYRVPEDVEYHYAELAIGQGMATLVKVEKEEAKPEARKRDRPRKVAPENKILHVAENKSAVH